MFGKRLNSIFWALLIPSIFFLFANTNFVNPIVKLNSNNEYYNVYLMDINNVIVGKGTYTETFSWILLLVLGSLFSLISLFVFAKFIFGSSKFENSKIRNYIPGMKKLSQNGMINYQLIEKGDKNKERDSKIVLIFFILMVSVVIISLLINFIVPFTMAKERSIAPTEEIQALGKNLTKVNELLAKYSNNHILWINLIGVLLCGIVAFALLVVAVAREVQDTKKVKS